MTKVRLSQSILEYSEAMAQLANEVREEKIIMGMGRPDIEDFGPAARDIVELWVPGLLRPPRIESVWPDMGLTDGHLDGLIQINTSEYFGIMNVYVVLEDTRGNIIESGYALDAEVVQNHWGYVPSAPLASGTTVIVRAIALDKLGGIGIQTERITVTKETNQWDG